MASRARPWPVQSNCYGAAAYSRPWRRPVQRLVCRCTQLHVCTCFVGADCCPVSPAISAHHCTALLWLVPVRRTSYTMSMLCPKSVLGILAVVCRLRPAAGGEGTRAGPGGSTSQPDPECPTASGPHQEGSPEQKWGYRRGPVSGAGH